MAAIETGKLLASAVVIRDGRALVLHELNDVGVPKYNLPGGHVDPGETPVVAMVREVKEETGLSCEPRTFLQVVVNTWEKNHSILFYFSVTADDGVPLILEDGITASWMTAEEVAALPDDQCVFGVKQAITRAFSPSLSAGTLLLRDRGESVQWE